jgi:predicted enzyme related to lactoylglutathione lyase
MAKQPTFGNGKICYIEIPASDINTSATFYQRVFGWNIRQREDGSVSFNDSVGEVSGAWVTGRKPAGEIGFVIYIMVDDLHASVELIEKNDGKILQVNTEGKEKLAQFTDPAGNIFGLYEQKP